MQGGGFIARNWIDYILCSNSLDKAWAHCFRLKVKHSIACIPPPQMGGDAFLQSPPTPLKNGGDKKFPPRGRGRRGGTKSEISSPPVSMRGEFWPKMGGDSKMADSPPVMGGEWVKKWGGTGKIGQNFLPPLRGGGHPKFPSQKVGGGHPKFPPQPSKSWGGNSPPTPLKTGGGQVHSPPIMGGECMLWFDPTLDVRE